MTLPPQFLRKRTISGMFPGEEGYTSHGALIVHEDRKCFLKGSYAIRDIATPYINLKVICRKDGAYAIDISNCDDSQWETSSVDGIEVVEILGGPARKKESEKEETARDIKRRKMNLE